MKFPAPLIVPLLLVILLLAIAPAGFGPARGASAATAVPPLSGQVTGPTLLGALQKGTFTVTGRGGPAEALNGTTVGTYNYSTTITATNGTTPSTGFVAPPDGVLINLSASFTVEAPNITGTYILTVEITSIGPGGTGNVSTNVTADFDVLEPYFVQATIHNPNGFAVAGAVVVVDLDGSTVGHQVLPSITADGSFDFSFNYTTTGLSSGWHTFTMTLTGTPGLLTFGNGAMSESSSFYVPPPPVNYTFDITVGLLLTVTAILISLMILGGRRPRRKKSP